jgi:hypothetical protein
MATAFLLLFNSDVIFVFKLYGLPSRLCLHPVRLPVRGAVMSVISDSGAHVSLDGALQASLQLSLYFQ